MANFLIDYSKIELRENIKLNPDEIKNIEYKIKDFFKNVPGILLTVIILIMLIAFFFLQNGFINFKYYHYLLIIFAAAILYAFFYFLIWAVYQYSMTNWRKDINNGKSELISIITNRHKTEYDEYMITFAGRNKTEKIQIPSQKNDYDLYSTGTWVKVTYLKYSKEILHIEKLE